jgi:hypothetical protein
MRDNLNLRFSHYDLKQRDASFSHLIEVEAGKNKMLPGTNKHKEKHLLKVF